MNITYLIVIFSSALAILLVVATIVSWTRAKERRDILIYLNGELDRAAEQVKTNNEDEIRSGLEKMMVFNSPSTRVAILPRLHELKNHNDKRIAETARNLENETFNTFESLRQAKSNSTEKKNSRAKTISIK
jgi:hypothetical protein